MPRQPFDQFDRGPKWPGIVELRRRFEDLRERKTAGEHISQKEIVMLRALVKVLPRRDTRAAEELEKDIHKAFPL